MINYHRKSNNVFFRRCVMRFPSLAADCITHYITVTASPAWTSLHPTASSSESQLETEPVPALWIKAAWFCLDMTNSWISMFHLTPSSSFSATSVLPCSLTRLLSLLLLHLLSLPPFLPHSPSSLPVLSPPYPRMSLTLPLPSPCCPHTSPPLPPSLPPMSYNR